MRIPRLYLDQHLTVGQTVELDPNSAHYVARVLRMDSGRPLVIFNGLGGEYNAEVCDVSKKGASIRVLQHDPIERESSLPIHLSIGISRGERMDWVLQKATELGVTTITPLFTERTEVRLKGERLEKKMQHWKQILISSCEQCQRNRLPTLNPASSLDTWLPTVADSFRFVLHHRSDSALPTAHTSNPVTLLIGPEGGLNDDEIDRAVSHQFKPLTLGPRVMRTETAPIAAISILQFIWGDLS